MAVCVECESDIDVDEFDVDRDDLLSCPDCGANLRVVALSPVVLARDAQAEASGAASDDDDDDGDDDDGDDDDDDDGDDIDPSCGCSATPGAPGQGLPSLLSVLFLTGLGLRLRRR